MALTGTGWNAQSNMNLRRLASALLAGTFAIGLAMAVTPAAKAETTHAFPLPIGSFAEIFPPNINPARHTCLDVPRGSQQPGIDLELFHCHGYADNGAPQLWRFEMVVAGNPNHGYRIVNKNARVPGGCVTNNTFTHRVVSGNCQAGYLENIWFPESMPGKSDQFTLTSFFGDCMAAENATGRNNVRVVVAACNSGDTRQIWTLG